MRKIKQKLPSIIENSSCLLITNKAQYIHHRNNLKADEFKNLKLALINKIDVIWTTYRPNCIVYLDSGLIICI